jgi:hypothetical protein
MQEFDLEKLKSYIANKFYFYEGILFSNIVKQPNSTELNNLKKNYTKQQFEKLYNHFHLNGITEDPNSQRQFAVQIWTDWRDFFSANYPDKVIIIDIIDFGIEVILYVYESE